MFIALVQRHTFLSSQAVWTVIASAACMLKLGTLTFELKKFDYGRYDTFLF